GGLPQAHAAIIATTGQQRAIRTPRHPADPGWLRTAHPPLGAGANLPHVHPLLIARTGQLRSIRTPRYPIEEGVDVVMVLQDLPCFSRGRVPQPDGIVQPATDQQPAIWTPRHPTHEGAMTAQQPGWGQTFHI